MFDWAGKLSFGLKWLFFCLFLLFSSWTYAFSSELLISENDFDSLIVQPKQRVLRANRISKLLFRYGFDNIEKVKNDTYIVPIQEHEDVKLKIKELKQSGNFNLVEPNYKLYIDALPQRNYVKVIISPDDKVETKPPPQSDVTPNDKDFSSQYYLRETSATKAWRTTVGDELLVAVLDTGVDATHPDLAGKIEGDSYCLIDSIGHGTGVGGLIAANTNNKQGIAGIAWKTKILSIRITDDKGTARVSSVIDALEEAFTKGAKIIQISLSTNQFSSSLRNAIKEAQDRGLLIISTAGNTGVQELRYPGAFDGVIAVGAVDQNKTKEDYSTTGEHVSLVAPGSSIYTTSVNSLYDSFDGTSFAAPQVAGAAALVWSIAPDLTGGEVRNILIQSAEDLGIPGKDKEYGYGLLNIEKAVELAKKEK